MKIRCANEFDADRIEHLEVAFCSERRLPPERSDGVRCFLKAGGMIYVCENESELFSAFWVIRVENLQRVNLNELPHDSPLRCILSSDLKSLLDSSSLLVFSWTPTPWRGIWLFRFLRRLGARDFAGQRVIGFVAATDATAVRNYLRMGCTIATLLPRVYSSHDVHFVVEYIAGVSKVVRPSINASTPPEPDVRTPAHIGTISKPRQDALSSSSYSGMSLTFV